MVRLLATLTVITCSLSLAQSVPGSITFNARLSDTAGAAVTGSHSMAFGLYDQATGGAPTWTENLAGASFSAEGLVYVELGAVTPLTTSALDGRKLYLEISVDGTTMTPRLPVVSVPYAIRASVATTADSVGSLAASAIQRRVTGTCPAGQAVRSVDSNGGVQCEPVGASPMTCASGEVLKSNGTGWVCAADAVGITGVTAGAGLTGGGGTAPTLSVVYGSAAGTAAQGNDPRLSDARAPTAASPSYVQNQAAGAQVASFNVSGSGAVGTSFAIGGNDVLSLPSLTT